MQDTSHLGEFQPILPLLKVPDHGTIVVAGCYEGNYVEHLHGMFPTAHIIGFEPQFAPWVTANARFFQNPRITILNEGLGTGTREMTLDNRDTVGATVVGTGSRSHHARASMVDAVEALHGFGVIDLMVLNMEGYEWVLLPHLLNELMQHKIRRLAVQFHSEYVSPREAALLLDRLNDYYLCLHNNYPAWTYWTRINI